MTKWTITGHYASFRTWPHLNKVADDYVSNTQIWSGLNNGSTDFAHLYVKACLDYAALKNLSACILFLDVRTAFAAVLRHFISIIKCRSPLKLCESANIDALSQSTIPIGVAVQ